MVAGPVQVRCTPVPGLSVASAPPTYCTNVPVVGVAVSILIVAKLCGASTLGWNPCTPILHGVRAIGIDEEPWSRVGALVSTGPRRLATAAAP